MRVCDAIGRFRASARPGGGVQCRQSADAVPTRIMSSSPLRDVRSGQINRHFVKTLSRCPKLMTAAISRFRRCPRIITPFRGDSARRLVQRWGSRQEGGVVRHGDVRHQVRPDEEGLAPPAGAVGLGPVDCRLLRLHRGLSSSSASSAVPHLRACRPSIAVRDQPVRRDAASAFGLLAPT